MTASWKRPWEGAQCIEKSACTTHVHCDCFLGSRHTPSADFCVFALPACKTPPSRLRAGNPAAMSGYPPQGEQGIENDQVHVAAQASVCLVVRASWSCKIPCCQTRDERCCCSAPAPSLRVLQAREVVKGWERLAPWFKSGEHLSSLAISQNMLTLCFDLTQATRVAPLEGKEATDRAHHRCERVAEVVLLLDGILIDGHACHCCPRSSVGPV